MQPNQYTAPQRLTAYMACNTGESCLPVCITLTQQQRQETKTSQTEYVQQQLHHL
jgi:hypothetical protein